jgi:hypothetical protein
MRVSKFSLLRSLQPSDMKGAFAEIAFKVSLLCTRQSVFFAGVLVLPSLHCVFCSFTVYTVILCVCLYRLQCEPELGSVKTRTRPVVAKSVSL